MLAIPEGPIRQSPVRRTGWQASLSLEFARSGVATRLTDRQHQGPLMVQKPLYPEGRETSHVVIVHAPGGIAGGDELAVDLRLHDNARALLTTPAAGKWYKADGREARLHSRFAVASGAVLEWLPQETIVFDAASAQIETEVTLAANAVFAGWEITCLGRRASGECFTAGRLVQHLRILRGDRLIWNERLALRAGDRLMQSPVGLNGRHVTGTMVVAGRLPATLLDACRAIGARRGEVGVTALPDVFAARYVGHSAEHARGYFESLRTVLRPWYAGRPAVRPRVWDT